MRIGAQLARVARNILRGVRQLGLELGSPVPLMLVLGWLRRPRRRTQVAPPLFRRIEVEPDFHEGHYPLIVARLRSTAHNEPTASGTLLDLRARVVQLDLFEYLATTWQAAPGDVPRLGVVLDYELWALLRIGAERLLRPVADRHVHVFYAQQEQEIPEWFAHGKILHSNLRGVIAWLRQEWQQQPPAYWSKVLDATTLLIQSEAAYDEVPDLIVELVDIALSFEDAAAADHASRYARAALHWAGTVPSPARCRALRSLAMTQLRIGDARAALLYLNTAIRDALMIGDRVEEVRALTELAGYSVRDNNLARAENQLRRAYELLTPEAPAALRATVCRGLADVRNQQGLNDDETERHAVAALLLDDEDSDLADQDYALLARIWENGDDRSTAEAAEAADAQADERDSR
jgi:hypothetical protein